MRLAEKSKQLIKWALASCLYYSGGLAIYQRVVMRQKAVIIVYHRILKDDTDLVDYSPYGMSVRLKTFEAHMRYLAKNYDVVPISRLTSLMARGTPLPGNLCAVTFDDGWLDNYQFAFPILRRLGLPATIFLATNFVEGTVWFWEERLKYLLAHIFQVNAGDQAGVESREVMRAVLGRYELAELYYVDPTRLPAYLTNVVNRARNMARPWRDSLMRELEQLITQPGFQEPRRFLNWQEISEMADQQVEFAAHTCSHTPLPGCPSHQLNAELIQSKAVIEQHVNRPVTSFAYPYGKYDPAALHAARQAGFKVACTLDRGLNDRHVDPFCLRRIDIYQDTAPTRAFFACRMLGLLNVY